MQPLHPQLPRPAQSPRGRDRSRKLDGASCPDDTAANTAKYELFSSVPLDHSLSFLSDPLVTGARATPSLRHYYRPALDLAMAIVRRYAVDVEVTRRGVDLPSMVLDKDSIFESYLRNTLQAEAGRAGGGVDVLDGNAAGKKPLFDDPPSENATPDIVFSRGGHRWPLVIEVKNVPVKGKLEPGCNRAGRHLCGCLSLQPSCSGAPAVAKSRRGRAKAARPYRGPSGLSVCL